MAAPTFKFYELDIQAGKKLDLDPLPFPVRAKRARDVFENNSVDLEKILAELDVFIEHNPEELHVYRNNIEILAMVSATNLIHSGNAKAALTCLGYGLRVNPANNSLRLHQALALQMNGYHEIAALEYEALLKIEPIAYDPIVRALAAKAYSACGQKENGLRVLEGLPETSFKDDDLQALRLSLQNEPTAGIHDGVGTDAGESIEHGRSGVRSKYSESISMSASENDEPISEFEINPGLFNFVTCQSCYSAVPAGAVICARCGLKISINKGIPPSVESCISCGINLKPGKKFCTGCGANVS